MMQVAPRPSYAIEKIIENENSLICKSEQLTLRISVFSDTIIEIAFTPLSVMDKPRNLGRKINWDWREKEKEIVIRTNALTAKIARCDGKVQIFDVYRTLDEPKAPLEYVVTPDGKKNVVTAPKRVYDKKLAHLQLKFTSPKMQGFYGLGQQVCGGRKISSNR